MFRSSKFLVAAVLATSYFEGEAGAAGAAAGAAAGGAAAGSAAGTAAGSAGTAAGAAGAQNRTFTQDELNTFVATERKKLTERMTSLEGTLNLTNEQKAQLASQIDELKSSHMTEKERAAQELDRQRKDSEQKFNAAKQEGETWRNRFTTSLIDTQLTQGSVANDAYNPAQIRAILHSASRIVPVLDEQNKPTGEFIVKTKIQQKKADGTTADLDLPPAEAIKVLKEQPEFANLFRGTQVAGVGGSNGSGTRPGPVDLKNMTQEQYMAQRKQLAGRGK